VFQTVIGLVYNPVLEQLYWCVCVSDGDRSGVQPCAGAAVLGADWQWVVLQRTTATCHQHNAFVDTS